MRTEDYIKTIGINQINNPYNNISQQTYTINDTNLSVNTLEQQMHSVHPKPDSLCPVSKSLINYMDFVCFTFWLFGTKK